MFSRFYSFQGLYMYLLEIVVFTVVALAILTILLVDSKHAIVCKKQNILVYITIYCYVISANEFCGYFNQIFSYLCFSSFNQKK